jgi:hypothetical protein
MAGASAVVLGTGGVLIASSVISNPAAIADTSAYELVCPLTPVGTVVIDNVVTTGSLSPAQPTSGQSFSVTGFQTQVIVSGALLSAAAAFGTSLSGSATSQVDVQNATPSSMSTGTLSFDVPIPSPTPSSLTLDLPSSAATIGPFTASSTPVVATVDQSSTLKLNVGSGSITLTCTSYPNDSNPTPNGILPGSSSTNPGTINGTPTAPVIAQGGASLNSTTTASQPSKTQVVVGTSVTDMATVTGDATHGSPTGKVSFYECGPAATSCSSSTGTAVGGAVDVSAGASNTATATSSAFTPGALGKYCFVAAYGGDSNYNGSSDGSSDECFTAIANPNGDSTTTVTTPSATSITIAGSPSSATDTATVTGDATYGSPTGSVTFYECGPSATSCSSSTGTPVGSAVTVNAGSSNTATATSAAFTPSAAGNYCFDAEYSGDGHYKGSSDGSSTECLTAKANPGATAPYELVCPGTPVGTVVIDDVVTTGQLSPAEPSSGQQFNVTNFQTQVTLKGALLSAAAAFGSTLSGSATSTVDASNATPAQISTGAVAFDVAIPSPTPASLVLDLPSSPATIGPFTATGSPVVAVDKNSKLVLTVAGNPITLTCTAYPNDSNPTSTGIISGSTQTVPGTINGSPIFPVIAPAGATFTPTASEQAATTTASPSSSASTPSTSSGTLAFTGAGPKLWLLGIVGFVLLDLGYLMVTVVDRPRDLLRRALRRAAGRSETTR